MSGGELPLPAIGFLDAAAKEHGHDNWAECKRTWHPRTSHHKGIIAHARTLQQLAKYERPAPDEAELKRRQDAREFAARAYDRVDMGGAGKRVRNGEHDSNNAIFAIYEYACHRDNVTPTPVDQWGAGK